MLFRPQLIDFKVIGFYLGKIVLGFGCFMIAPAALSLFLGEINPFLDFIISILFCAIIGLSLHIFCYTKKEPNWSHGLIVVSFSWILASLLGALPLFLSGHYSSFLDSVFEVMSGLTTTGLSLTMDLNHLSFGHNLWRHVTHFIGGQGIVLVVLSFFVQGIAGSFRFYVGEAREEKVFPNIQKTSRFIWVVSFVYLVLGSLALALAAYYEGMPFGKALFNGACIFMAAFDTGGFAPHDPNFVYYHSVLFETIAMVIMVLGAINFRIHYVLWSGQRSEILKNFEIRTLLFTILSVYALMALSLSRQDVYTGWFSMFRRGFFQLMSAHTGTGFQNIYSTQFISEWGGLALCALIFAMSLGGCITSTTGGIKIIRLGVIAKAYINDVKHYVSPEKAVFWEKIHHVKDMVLTDKQVRAACLIVIAYISTFFFGAVMGLICGYPFLESFFESVSATANVGLSCGITSVSMPAALKLTYIFQMWAGRLEFISVFALAGYIYALIRGR